MENFNGQSPYYSIEKFVERTFFINAMSSSHGCNYYQFDRLETKIFTVTLEFCFALLIFS